MNHQTKGTHLNVLLATGVTDYTWAQGLLYARVDEGDLQIHHLSPTSRPIKIYPSGEWQTFNTKFVA